MQVTCQECGKACWKVKGPAIYGRSRYTDDKWFWLCACGAYVGCHPGTTDALGTAAGPILRKKRKAAHAFFDKLWQVKHERDGVDKGEARRAAYAWLARQMGTTERVHMARMSIAQCEAVIRICRPYYDRLIEQENKRLGYAT